jgi:hypothetical protein
MEDSKADYCEGEVVPCVDEGGRSSRILPSREPFEAFSNLDLAGFAGCLRQLRHGSIQRGIIRSQSFDC